MTPTPSSVGSSPMPIAGGRRARGGGGHLALLGVVAGVRAARVLPVGLAVAVVVDGRCHRRWPPGTGVAVGVGVGWACAGRGCRPSAGSRPGAAGRAAAPVTRRRRQGRGAASTAGSVGRPGLPHSLAARTGLGRLRVGGALQPLAEQRAEVLADRARLAAVERGAERVDALRLAAGSVNTTLPDAATPRGRTTATASLPFFTPPATVTPAGADLTFTRLGAAGDGDGHLAFGGYRHRQPLGRAGGWRRIQGVRPVSGVQGGERGAWPRRYGRARDAHRGPLGCLRRVFEVREAAGVIGGERLRGLRRHPGQRSPG